MSTVVTEKQMKYTLFRQFSCSETMLTVLNRMGGCEMKEIEEASDPLCGGILLNLHDVCGIVWGASLAAGIRAKQRLSSDYAVAQFTLGTTKQIIDTFDAEEDSVECATRIGMDKWNMIKYTMKGNIAKCMESLAHWAPRFNEIIETRLVNAGKESQHTQISNCACETMEKTAEKLGIDLAWYVPVVAGFAGGLGLSGNACGALTAAILGQMLKYFINRDKPKHSMIRSGMQAYYIGDSWMNPARKLFKDFIGMYGTKSCREITQRQFNSPDELSAFLESGKCREIIDNVVKWV
jgi:hypothetical protein